MTVTDSEVIPFRSISLAICADVIVDYVSSTYLRCIKNIANIPLEPSVRRVSLPG